MTLRGKGEGAGLGQVVVVGGERESGTVFFGRVMCQCSLVLVDQPLFEYLSHSRFQSPEEGVQLEVNAGDGIAEWAD